MQAASWQASDEIKLLLSKGIYVNSWNRYNRITLIRDSLGLVKYLIKHGADVNIKDNWESTALIRAEQKNNKQIIKLLKEHGAQ